MESYKTIESILESSLPNHEYTIYTYLDKDCKKLKSSNKSMDNSTFINKEVSYDEEGRVTKSVEEVYYGAGMKKKYIGSTTETFSYETTDKEEITTIITEVFDNAKKTSNRVAEKINIRDLKTGISEYREKEYDLDSNIKNKKLVINSNDYSCTIFSASIFINNTKNKSYVQYFNQAVIEYYFDEKNITERIFRYDNNDQLINFKEILKEDNVDYDIICYISDDKASFNIEVYDKNHNILAEHDFTLDLTDKEQYALFNNIFNLSIKDIEDVYGKGCLKTEDQFQTVLIKDTDFDMLFSKL